jgi:hypothetical protein
MSLTGTRLLEDVAARILARWLEQRGRVDVRNTEGRESLGGRAVNLSYAWEGGRRLIKVKPDPYYGTDAAKIRDRNLVFYRPDSAAFAFEAVANTATKEPGWVIESPADDVYYYYVAISQPEAEVRALLGEPDEVFFSELAVDRDDLVIMPMNETRSWFERSYQKYTPRPVTVSGASSWVRVVPRADFESGVAAATDVGPVFRTLA